MDNSPPSLSPDRHNDSQRRCLGDWEKSSKSHQDVSLSSISIEHFSSSSLNEIEEAGQRRSPHDHTLTTSSIDSEKQLYCGSKPRCFFQAWRDSTVGLARQPSVGMVSQGEAQLRYRRSLRTQKERRLEANVHGSGLWIANSFPKSARKRRFTHSRISEVLYYTYTERLTVSYTDIHCHKVGISRGKPQSSRWMDDISKPCATD